MAVGIPNKEVFGIGGEYPDGRVCKTCGATGPDYHSLACERGELPVEPTNTRMAMVDTRERWTEED